MKSIRSGTTALGSFRFQKIYQMVVCSRREFYKDLTYNTYTGFFDIKYFNVVEVVDNVAAEFFEFSA